MGQIISTFIGADQLDQLCGNANDLDLEACNQLKMGRHILVTGGATVAFKELLIEVTTPKFVTTLKTNHFKHLHIQCGDFTDEIVKRAKELGDIEGFEVDVFDFNFDLKTQMQILCRGEADVKPAGVVIGHAGTGTIADALESEVALIIVANPNLMDNHQAKFAAEMEAEHDNVVQGQLGKLDEAIPKVLDVIAENRLDDLDPLEEEANFPLCEDDRLKIFDQVIASGL